MVRNYTAVLIGALLVVLAQIIIAPNIALFSAMPNFLLVYVLVVAVVRPAHAVYVLAFVLGLLFDLLGFGPLGSMAVLMVLAAFVVSRMFMYLNNDTFFMPLAVLGVALVAVEILYGVFLVSLGFADSVLEAFAYRALPCALYDCVIALILYPLAMKFLVPDEAGPHAPATSQLVQAAGDTMKRRPPAHNKRLR